MHNGRCCVTHSLKRKASSYCLFFQSEHTYLSRKMILSWKDLDIQVWEKQQYCRLLKGCWVFSVCPWANKKGTQMVGLPWRRCYSAGWIVWILVPLPGSLFAFCSDSVHPGRLAGSVRKNINEQTWIWIYV